MAQQIKSKLSKSLIIGLGCGVLLFLLIIIAVIAGSNYKPASLNNSPSSTATEQRIETSETLNPEGQEPSTFHGYECTEDCSGHEAGYEWAEEHDITDPSDCGGKSNSFIEGCEAYAEENSY